MIEVRDLSLRVEETTILDGLSFTVAKGEALGIVGDSGSGKSTILRVLAGLATGWSGEVLVNGASPRSSSPRDLGRHLQMVFQDPYGSLHPRQTVERILREPIDNHHLGDADARIAAALAEVRLDEQHRSRFPNQLSGGQRQRVAIARALMLNPAVLLLDEPTTALDMTAQKAVLDLLERVRRDHGMTFLLVSHDLAVVARLCDRVLVIDRGRIVEELSAESLRAGDATHASTKALIAASKGYRRAVPP
jgi:peptide/nickel transport system ATP-binding protein